MATGLQSWSKTASSNATADSNVNWAEGQTPGSVNNSSRAEMASAAMWRDDNAGTITTGGTSTAYTATSNQTLALSDGATITLQMSATNGAAATLNVDSSGAKPLQSVSGTALPAATTLLNGIYRFVYRSSPDARILHGAVNAYTVGGTDVAIADGGTGQSTATLGFDALAPTTTRGDLIARGASSNGRLAVGAANTVLGTDGTDPIWAKIVAANITDATITAGKLASAIYAAQSDMESASSTSLLVTPGLLINHPGMPKATGCGNGTSGGVIGTAYNITSIVRNSTGRYTVTLAVTMSNSTYWVVVCCKSAGGQRSVGWAITSTTVFTVAIDASTGGTRDEDFSFAVYGDM